MFVLFRSRLPLREGIDPNIFKVVAERGLRLDPGQAAGGKPAREPAPAAVAGRRTGAVQAAFGNRRNAAAASRAMPYSAMLSRSVGSWYSAQYDPMAASPSSPTGTICMLLTKVRL